MIKYFLLISAIINSLLLVVVLGPVPFFLYLSVIFNIASAWYVLRLLKERNMMMEDLISVFDLVEDFLKHLEDIHELETYYGDQELQNLINHSKSLINNIIDIQEIYYDDINIIEEDYDSEEVEDHDSEEETPKI